MKFETFKVMSEKKEVGQVTVPIFEEKEPTVGLQEIQEFDWSATENGGYKSWQEAVVSLVNTQHGTNMRNRLRQQKSGKMTAAAIEAQAMATCTMEELQGAVGDPAKFLQLKDRKIKEYKAKLEEQKGSQPGATTTTETNGGEVDQEAADAEAAEAATA